MSLGRVSSEEAEQSGALVREFKEKSGTNHNYCLHVERFHEGDVKLRSDSLPGKLVDVTEGPSIYGRANRRRSGEHDTVCTSLACLTTQGNSPRLALLEANDAISYLAPLFGLEQRSRGSSLAS